VTMPEDYHLDGPESESFSDLDLDLDPIMASSLTPSAPVYSDNEHATTDESRILAMSAWATEGTRNIAMNSVLALAFAKILDKQKSELTSQPWLGNATNGQLLDELRARINLDYSTTGREIVRNEPSGPTGPMGPPGHSGDSIQGMIDRGIVYAPYIPLVTSDVGGIDLTITSTPVMAIPRPWRPPSDIPRTWRPVEGAWRPVEAVEQPKPRTPSSDVVQPGEET